MVETVLLADNNPDDVLLLVCAFRQAGFEVDVRVTQDGSTTIDYLQGAGKYADRGRYPFPMLLLMELRLPRIDGTEVLRWIREHPQFQNLPVVMLSGPVSQQQFESAYRLGANACLIKPLSFYELVELVRNQLSDLIHGWQAAA